MTWRHIHLASFYMLSDVHVMCVVVHGLFVCSDDDTLVTLQAVEGSEQHSTYINANFIEVQCFST